MAKNTIVKNPASVEENTTARAPRKVADALKVNTRLNRDKSTKYDSVLSVELVDYTPSVFTRTEVQRTYAVKVTPANVHSRVISAFMASDISTSSERKHRLADFYSDEMGGYIITRFGGDDSALQRVIALLWGARLDSEEHLFNVKSPAVVAKCAKRVDDILIGRRTALDGAFALAEYESEKASAIRAWNKEYAEQMDDDIVID